MEAEPAAPAGPPFPAIGAATPPEPPGLRAPPDGARDEDDSEHPIAATTKGAMSDAFTAPIRPLCPKPKRSRKGRTSSMQSAILARLGMSSQHVWSLVCDDLESRFRRAEDRAATLVEAAGEEMVG